MKNIEPKNRYNSIGALLKSKFGGRVYKVTLDAALNCPNRDGTCGEDGCIFCNTDSYQSFTDLNLGVDEKSISEQLNAGMDYIRKRHQADKFISYFQSGSNTHAPAKILEPIFNAAIDSPDVIGLAISTRPDCIDEEHLKLLKKLSEKTFLWVELGLQSSHDETLKKINRGHTVDNFLRTNELLLRNGINVCAHVILGLPGETREMMFETAAFLNKSNVWGVKVHNLHVLKETKLEKIHSEGMVNIPSLGEYANLVVDFLELLSPEIIIHRLNGHSPRKLTIAPTWSINKLGIINEIQKVMRERDSHQGKRYS